MGIRGTVRRSTDGHIIHANIDTDVIIAEEPPYGQYNSLLEFLALVCLSPFKLITFLFTAICLSVITL
jgi:hypothetical protein